MFSQIWTPYVENGIDVTNLFQTKAEFSYDMAVMEKVDDWNKKGWTADEKEPDSSGICVKFAACKDYRREALKTT